MAAATTTATAATLAILMRERMISPSPLMVREPCDCAAPPVKWQSKAEPEPLVRPRGAPGLRLQASARQAGRCIGAPPGGLHAPAHLRRPYAPAGRPSLPLRAPRPSERPPHTAPRPWRTHPPGGDGWIRALRPSPRPRGPSWPHYGAPPDRSPPADRG